MQATLQIALKFARRRDQLLDSSIVRVLQWVQDAIDKAFAETLPLKSGRTWI